MSKLPSTRLSRLAPTSHISCPEVTARNRAFGSEAERMWPKGLAADQGGHSGIVICDYATWVGMPRCNGEVVTVIGECGAGRVVALARLAGCRALALP